MAKKITLKLKPKRKYPVYQPKSKIPTVPRKNLPGTKSNPYTAKLPTMSWGR